LLVDKLPDTLQADAALLIEAVRDAGALALTLFQQNVRNWSKSDGSVVTEADLQIDRFLKTRLHDERLSYGWLSEETPDSAERLGCDHLWIVDPIDGTTAFVNKGTEWCVGVALVQNDRPILSAIYRPMVDELYFGAVGVGAFCNGLPMKVRDSAELEGTEIMATGKAKSHLLNSGVIASKTYMPLLMRLAYVASGKTDITMSFGNKNDWDLAAGDLLVQESGGRVSTLDGEPMTYNKPEPWQNGMVAAGLERHSAVMVQLEAK
jgi:myo-inositol-1(or 4)-monophosphatase